MDLEERIARLIDPDSWAFADRYRDELPDTAEYLIEESRTTARRVIDGLGLEARNLPPEEADTIMKVDDGYEPYVQGDWT